MTYLTTQDIRIVVQNLTDQIVKSFVPSQSLIRVVLIQITVHLQELLAQNVVVEYGERKSSLFRLRRHLYPFPELAELLILVIEIFLAVLILHFSIELSQAANDSIINLVQTCESL